VRKIVVTTYLFALGVLAVHAEQPRLLLVPVETSIKPHSKVSLDVYLCNTSRAAVNAPSLQLISVVYSWSNVNDPSHAGAASETKVTTSEPMPHILSANAVESKRIDASISVEPGDLVKVYVHIGPPPHLRSNAILMFCPTKQKQ
jgi:hypothetical protein